LRFSSSGDSFGTNRVHNQVSSGRYRILLGQFQGTPLTPFRDFHISIRQSVGTSSRETFFVPALLRLCLQDGSYSLSSIQKTPLFGRLFVEFQTSHTKSIMVAGSATFLHHILDFLQRVLLLPRVGPTLEMLLVRVIEPV
jgi:hypothetical protein